MSDKDLENLYPKWICPKCGDWFHMPWKFCSCPRAQKLLQLINQVVLKCAVE